MTDHPKPLLVLLTAIGVIAAVFAVAAGAAVIVGALMVAAAAFDAGRHLAPIYQRGM